ncbi:MAG: hypothetical protein ACOX6F_03090 [Syntrophomonadaceae bacterium]|jgi:PBP1b-binding outer membrane lipoprotein LpoB|nr:hypothetical protein [Bacillota bacterium]NLM88007.1 hypothetical protein [Syntrophomonadaceae bacterium]HAA10054.1 hypothetical protein [Syntrophomonas sp.]HQA49360.1 hypothetical protein [Syntrophomonadaceae bacterium]HQD89743.1 hypothetical protein [Syntrophomonadaceae bacterium]
MKLMKRVGLLLILGLMAAMLIGCAGGSDPADQQSENNNLPQQEETVNPESEAEAIKDTAIYSGRIDNNSVEMFIEDSPVSFQLTEELIETWDSLGFEEGEQLEIQYQERENNRPVLLKAEKA